MLGRGLDFRFGKVWLIPILILAIVGFSFVLAILSGELSCLDRKCNSLLIWGFVLGTVFFSIIFTWVYNNTGKKAS
ncbi:MAG: hypothetical protein ACPLF9_03620 [Methanothermobacter tenebrarum]